MHFRFKTVSKILARTNGSETWGALMLAGAVVVFFLTALRVDTSRTPFRNLDPVPDAAEYFAGAVSLKEEGRFAIQLAGRFYPPRYPPGYSAFLLPFLYLPMDPVEAPFVANRALGAALLLSGALLLWRAGHPMEAGLSSLLLATHPSFILLARSPMAELASSLLVFSGFWGVYLYLRRGSVRSGCLGSLILGLSLTLKVSNLFWLPILIAAPLAAPFPLRRRLRHAAAFVGFGLIAAAPLFAYNWSTFGSPLLTGYHFWVPYWADLKHAFDTGFVPGQLGYWWRETIQRETPNMLAGYFGSGFYWGPTFPLLCLVAAIVQARRRWFRVLAAVGLFYLAMMSLYFYRDGRLLFSLFPLALPAIAVTLGDMLRSRRRWVVGTGLTLLVFQTLSFPGPHARPRLGTYLRVSRIHGPAHQYQLAKDLESIRGARPALVLTDLNPPYVYALMGGERVVSFLTDTHDYRFNPEVFVYGGKERQAQVEDALGRGWEVYAVWRGELQTSIEGLAPPPTGYRWETLTRGETLGGGIARLVHD